MKKISERISKSLMLALPLLLLWTGAAVAQPPVAFPDNIDSSVDCFGMPAATTWSMEEIPPIYKEKQIHNYMPLLTGDIDGDNVVEIIGAAPKDGSQGNYDSDSIRMFTYDGAHVQFKKDIYLDGITVSTYGSMAMARYNNRGYIVFMGALDTCLYAYDAVTGTQLWKSESTLEPSNVAYVSIADFNSDSIPEVFVGNRIYSMATGELLCAGTGNRGTVYQGGATNEGCFSFAADVTGDGKLDLCAGTQVYEVNIPQNATVAGTGTMTVNIELPITSLPVNALPDGMTTVADIDNDGQLEVIVSTLSTGLQLTVYVWKPLQGGASSVLGSYGVDMTGGYSHAIPMIGNIDGDAYPEIVFITNKTAPMYMYALKYDPDAALGSRLVEKWRLEHTDGSGHTGMSLFDFNLDGVNEIVYRDQNSSTPFNTGLRIINGDDTTPKVLATFSNISSGTLSELPVIADLDNDGQAEIVVTGRDTVSASNQNGYLRVFESGGAPWAYARPVWNQYAYNAVNVNEDLTIPTEQFNPATEFPGVNGNPVRPFNGFMTQQTKLSTDGTPFLPLPDMALAAPAAELSTSLQYTYYNAGDSLVLTAKVVNTGDAALNPPVAFAAYKDEILPENLVGDGLYSHQILQGDTAVLHMRIENFIATHPDAEKVQIRLNDDGSNFPAQAICTGDATRMSATLDIMIAEADNATTLKNNPVTISVLANDSLGSCVVPDTVIVITPSPDGTTTVSENGAITFTPNADYSGTTTFVYQIKCDGKLASAVVTVNVLGEYPDNINDNADCFTDPPEFDWTIDEDWHSDQANVATYMPPVVGDLDQDGLSEIIVGRMGINGASYRSYDTLYVYKGSDRTAPPIIIPTEGNYMQAGAVGIARIPTGTDTVPLVVTIDSLGYLRAYNPFKAGGITSGNDYRWISDKKIVESYVYTPHATAPSVNVFGSVSFADFNNDGAPEIYCGNRIFDAATGVMLVDGTTTVGEKAASHTLGSNVWQYLPAVADIDQDGALEYIAGTSVFEVDITGGTFTETVTIPPIVEGMPASMTQGYTLLADINKDGHQDVILTNQYSGKSAIAVWDIHTQALLGTIVEPTNTGGTGDAYYKGVPFIGDVDADGNVEIVMTTVNALKGFRWDGTSALTKVYEITTTDVSGATGMTLFDFNQDGIPEIVYRDQTDLRVMEADKANATFIDLLPLTTTPGSGAPFVSSGTYVEYPVVADVNNDGSAEIVVVGGGTALEGTVRIYNGGENPWAPARSVWNQYAYNAVNVNEDLTIPRNPINSATIFPGEDGVSGTPDDTQPFNNFLQQQTKVNQYGVSYWTLPDLQWNSQVEDPAVYHYHADGDSLTITAHISNPGDAMLEAPISFAVYKESVAASNLLGVGICPTDVLPGDTAAFSLRIDNFMSQYASVENLVVRLNDDGVTFPALEVCSNTSINIPLTTISATNDRVSTLQNNAVTISVLANDSLGSCPEPKITVPVMANGVATANDKGEIVFTPDTDYAGITTFTYQVECDGLFASAVVTVNVLGEYPDNISNADCFGEPEATKWGMQQLGLSTELVNIAISPLVGNMDNDPDIEILTMNSIGNGASNLQGSTANKILIFAYDEARNPKLYKKYEVAIPVVLTAGNTWAIAKVGSDPFPSIFLTTNNATVTGATDAWRLIKYTFEGTTLGKQWQVPYGGSGNNSSACSPIVADFMGSGKAQVAVYDKIFDAQTGTLLVNGGFLDTPGHNFGDMAHNGAYTTLRAASWMAADIDNDHILEIVAGNCTYKVNITNFDTEDAANTYTLLATATGVMNGTVATADIDKDGLLDVATTYRNSTGGNAGCMAVYNPRTGELMSQIISDIPVQGGYGPAMPFIGDITGDGSPKIAFVGYSTMRAYKYNAAKPVNNRLEQLWEYKTNVYDPSSSTGLTIFDFNQDGMSEIVYRDEDAIRIINGSLKSHLTGKDTTVYNLDSKSGLFNTTIGEYPVVADINNDGQAEIITSGRTTSPKNWGGSLQVFASLDPAGSPWASARKVWNQYSYNAVSVNEDLSIPTHQLSLTTRFPGEDGVLGTPDDVQPYNNFLQQQTTLSKLGTTLWLIPNGQIVGSPSFIYDNILNTMTVTVEVVNIGEAAFQAPFHVTAYKNEVGNAIKYTHAYDSVIIAGDTASITFSIPNYTAAAGWLPNEAVMVKINDKGDGLADQQTCSDEQTAMPGYGITNTPQDVCLGNVVPIECAFSLSSEDSYQWEMSYDKVTWAAIAGATSIDYQPTDRKPGTIYYRVKVTGNEEVANKQITSATASIRVRSCFMPVNPHVRGWIGR